MSGKFTLIFFISPTAPSEPVHVQYYRSRISALFCHCLFVQNVLWSKVIHKLQKNHYTPGGGFSVHPCILVTGKAAVSRPGLWFPKTLPSPPPHTAAQSSCSSRLLTGRGGLPWQQTSSPFNEVPNNNILHHAARKKTGYLLSLKTLTHMH